VFLERLPRDAEALHELVGGDLSRRVLAAAVEEVGGEGLKGAEALRCPRCPRAFDSLLLLTRDLARELGHVALVPLAHLLERGLDEPTKLRRRPRHGPPG